MIVTDEAFDELLDRVEVLGAGTEGADDPDGEAAEARRRQFAIAVDRAVKSAVIRRDGRAFHTQTMRRYRCRLHFLRSGPKLYLFACLPLDDDEPDYST